MAVCDQLLWKVQVWLPVLNKQVRMLLEFLIVSVQMFKSMIVRCLVVFVIKRM